MTTPVPAAAASPDVASVPKLLQSDCLDPDSTYGNFIDYISSPPPRRTCGEDKAPASAAAAAAAAALQQTQKVTLASFSFMAGNAFMNPPDLAVSSCSQCASACANSPRFRVFWARPVCMLNVSLTSVQKSEPTNCVWVLEQVPILWISAYWFAV